MTPASDDVAKLSKEIDQLRTDLSTLMDSLRTMGIERGHEATSRARQAGESIRAQAEELGSRAEREISARPVTSVLTAFGLGFLIGIVLDRRH